MKSVLSLAAALFSSQVFATEIPWLNYSCMVTSEVFNGDERVDVQTAGPIVAGYVNKSEVGLVSAPLNTVAGGIQLGMQISIYSYIGQPEEYMEAGFFDYVENKNTGFPEKIFGEATMVTKDAPLPQQFGIQLADRQMNGFSVRNKISCEVNP